MSNRDLTTLRQDFHQFPELGFQENRTKKKVAEILRDIGLEVHEGAGVVGILRAGQGNRAIGLRADMDALPVHEKSSHDYAPQIPGDMHVCGHDGHMTMLPVRLIQICRIDRSCRVVPTYGCNVSARFGDTVSRQVCLCALRRPIRIDAEILKSETPDAPGGRLVRKFP